MCATSKPPTGRRDLEKTEFDFRNCDDPFSLRNGYVPVEELSRLTKRKNGKKLQAYQRKQNKVERIPSEYNVLFMIAIPNSLAYRTCPKTHGNPHFRSRTKFGR